jgi:hypothetical protein
MHSILLDLPPFGAARHIFYPIKESLLSSSLILLGPSTRLISSRGSVFKRSLTYGLLKLAIETSHIAQREEGK